ncbi:hypothetical protein JTE90_016261 [Oedothorax gibbosus]|uniref:Uncharacterized protein n=1 Tax=Oedothorax gibbosus TaxID=931172 RepID=A0AAV6VR91_9ARAC|nr:hypothetical protein JTE90_016261 [Oedothorax gibbosus]
MGNSALKVRGRSGLGLIRSHSSVGRGCNIAGLDFSSYNLWLEACNIGSAGSRVEYLDVPCWCCLTVPVDELDGVTGGEQGTMGNSPFKVTQTYHTDSRKPTRIHRPSPILSLSPQQNTDLIRSHSSVGRRCNISRCAISSYSLWLEACNIGSAGSRVGYLDTPCRCCLTVSIDELDGVTGGEQGTMGNSPSKGSASNVDVALLAEAHGLVTDMLADPHLPPHVVGGLRSLASLLSPPSQVVNHRVQRPGGTSVSLADFGSGSDNEEIPYTGEKPSALTKRLRRNLPPSILRRMSTSTWTTTTSATGLPTLEPEPSRKRSTSFRHPTDSQNTSPRGGNSPQTGCALSPSRSHHVTIPTCPKGRSYSTTSIPSSALTRRNSRDRKTVCSLHPLTSAEIEAFHEAHAQGEDDLQLFQCRMVAAQLEADAETTEEDEPLPPLPCIRRAQGLVSSDYESSNESPVSSENNDLMAEHLMAKSLSVQTMDKVDRCSMCGAKTRHVEPQPLRSPKKDEAARTADEEEEAQTLKLNVLRYLPIVTIVGGHCYFVCKHLSKSPFRHSRMSERRLREQQRVPREQREQRPMAKSLSVQTMDNPDRCSMCVAKTRHGVGVEPQPLRSPKKDTAARTADEEEEVTFSLNFFL